MGLPGMAVQQALRGNPHGFLQGMTMKDLLMV
jgi:hypothetical protein